MDSIKTQPFQQLSYEQLTSNDNYYYQSKPMSKCVPQSNCQSVHVDNKFEEQKRKPTAKVHKSCPISPIHDKESWNEYDVKKMAIRPNIPLNHNINDARNILDMIHANTEKMIAEISQKYGDLDRTLELTNAKQSRAKAAHVPQKSARTCEDNTTKRALNSKQEQLLDDEVNFSSDSLEDCSLDLDANSNNVAFQRRKKLVCRKKHRKYDTNFPKRSISEYFVYDEFYNNRKVSLSDILHEDADIAKQNHTLSQRHSCASFFLVPEKKSQESLLSEDLNRCGVSYSNSMESILSDESECKSAPLEALFGRTKPGFNKYSMNKAEAECTKGDITYSKSYGSSPNNGTTGLLDYYMEARQPDFYYEMDAYNSEEYDISSHFPVPLPPLEFQNDFEVPKTKCMQSSYTCPMLSTISSLGTAMDNDDFIPRFGSKNDQYLSCMNKSLSKEFATQRQLNNSNPLYIDSEDNHLFKRKMIGSVANNMMEQVTENLFQSPRSSLNNPPKETMKKSCSFEIEMYHRRGKALQQKNAAKKYEKNLEKFEKDRMRQKNSDSPLGGTLEMPYVPHKPPVAKRRSVSMRTKRNPRENLSIEKRETAAEFHNPGAKSKTKASEHAVDDDRISVEDNNMDSLELYKKPNLVNSVDSLDDDGDFRKGSKSSCNDAEKRQKCSEMSTEFLAKEDYKELFEMGKKVQVINKLTKMEKNKLEQERVMKEMRMRPFQCNVKEKGYVKSLTMNFDNLAKSMQYEKELMQTQNNMSQEFRRNYSLPDVLEVAKYRSCDDGKKFFHNDSLIHINGYYSLNEGVRSKSVLN